LNLLIRIAHDPIVVVDKPDWQWKPQLSAACFVKFATVEARADNVQLRLGERALHAENQAIVELAGMVQSVMLMPSIV